MNVATSFLLNTSGLFDFDFTFLTEALLFLILAGVVTYGFISPISNNLNLRREFIDLKLVKAIIILRLGYEKILRSTDLLLSETKELDREAKLVKHYTNKKFEEEIKATQNDNENILNKLENVLIIQSAYILSNVLLSPKLSTAVASASKFFNKKI